MRSNKEMEHDDRFDRRSSYSRGNRVAIVQEITANDSITPRATYFQDGAAAAHS